MRLSDLIADLPVRLVRGAGDCVVTSIADDSRAVQPGSLFIARCGAKHDGRTYIADAIERGATAVLTDDPANVPGEVAVLTAADVSLASSLLAERFIGNPSSALSLVGITGTNGKTTTCYLLRHILNHAGIKCGLIGTVEVDDGGAGGVRPATLTTPPPIEVSGMLGAMVDNGCGACVMEASSHALHQRRVAALDFRIGIFTNLGGCGGGSGGGGDHLDYHGTVENYIAAKAMLFEAVRDCAIINIDDPAAEHMIRAAGVGGGDVCTCSLTDEEATCTASIDAVAITYCDITLRGPWGTFAVRLPLCGRHNVMNVLQAAAAAHRVGVAPVVLREALAKCVAPPGRLQPVTSLDDPFAVFVDYAHTDDALENVLRALKPLMHGGKLRVVFGCGGDRDRSKRPRMARAAWRWADDVIITSDNPRTEDPQAILNDIRAGVPVEQLVETLFIVDRAQAIHAAIQRMREGDVLVIAGKGHEDYQIIGETKRPFDDRIVAAEALRQLHQQAGAL